MTGPPPPTWAVDPQAASARELVPGLWRLRLPLSWDDIDHVNAYLVEQEQGVMLVDCGSGGHPSALQALEHAIAQAGHQLADVNNLVLTHSHSDHAGLARTIRGRFRAELWSHPATGHFYDVWRDPRRVEAARRRRAALEGVPQRRLDAYGDVREELTGVDGMFVADRLLSNGVKIPSSLGPWEVIETPGHAPSHVSLIQRERGLLIAGDTVCVAFVPWMDYGYSADPFRESLESLDLLEAQQPLTLSLPGHGRPLTDLDAVLAEHRAGFEAMLDRVLEAVRERPLTGYELSETIHGEEADIAAVGHLSEVLALLRHLRLRNEVTRVTSGDVHRYSDVHAHQRSAA